MVNAKTISFNAGPTYISDSTKQAIHEVVNSGFLSVSHRSPEFSAMSEKAIEGLRRQLRIPKEYHIFYQNSSTVAWDTVLQNLVKKQSFHFVCGEFSKRFQLTGEALKLNARKFDTISGHPVEWDKAPIDNKDELICITHNETRSGLMWPDEAIKGIRDLYPDILLAIDVCSSFAAMKMNWEDADIWLGSVQKGLAMPAGLGYLIVSPRALEKSLKLNKSIPNWRKFETMHELMKIYQIYETPNSLLIGTLAKLMENWDIDAIDNETRRKANLIYSTKLDWEPHVKDPKWQSLTSAHFMVDNAEKWHEKAEKANFALGKSFDNFADNGIRVCNFPSHTYKMVEDLLKALSQPKVLLSGSDRAMELGLIGF